MKTKFSKRELIDNVEMFQRIVHTETKEQYISRYKADKLKKYAKGLDILKKREERSKALKTPIIGKVLYYLKVGKEWILNSLS